MKITRLLPYLVIFSLSLLPGFWAGRQFKGIAQGPITSRSEKDHQKASSLTFNLPTSELGDRFLQNPPLPETLTQKPEPEKVNVTPGSVRNHQRNILILGVDDLETKQIRLESAWLVIYIPTNPHFMLLPLYPTQNTSNQNADAVNTLANQFKFNEDGTPSDSSLKSFQEKGLWWHGYLLLDRTALEGVFNFLDQPRGEKSAEQNLGSISTLLNQGLDFNTMISQAALIQEMCRRVSHLASLEGSQYLDLYSLMRAHIRSDLRVDEEINEWQNLTANGAGISCEFPSLTSSSNIP